jgi:DNA-binding SARP family transcriptional activator
MTLNAVLSDMYAAFQHHAAEARVVLLHAASRYRTALISRLLSDSDVRVFYYAMDTDDVDVRSFLAGFTHDLAEQVPTFGAHVNQVGLHDTSNLNPLLKAFAADLDELSNEPFFLLLDEFDRADIADDLQSFLESLIEIMPRQCRILISGRGLPRLPWMSLIAQRKAVMLRDAELVANDFYENQAQGKARLEISGLGPGHVMLDGEVVESWEGHLPRLLFFFALERPFVTRSEICQSFWPDLNNDQAVNVFHVTKRRLHKALDSLGVDVLVHENGYYRVNPALSIHYDVVDFVGALVEGRSSTDAAVRMAAWQHAIDLHQRPFLQGHTEGWIARRRQEYQTGYLEALTGMAEVRYNEGRQEHALALLQRAVNEDPRRQDIHRRLMSLYADLGRRSEAAGHYQRLQDTLKEYQLSMEDETKQLYKELMAQ